MQSDLKSPSGCFAYQEGREGNNTKCSSYNCDFQKYKYNKCNHCHKYYNVCIGHNEILFICNLCNDHNNFNDKYYYDSNGQIKHKYIY